MENSNETIALDAIEQSRRAFNFAQLFHSQGNERVATYFEQAAASLKRVGEILTEKQNER
jgi:hypothetical protein